MSKTASYIKDRYNAKTYDRYTFYLRKDETLNDRLQADKGKQPISQIIKDALLTHYDDRTEPSESAQPKQKAKPKPPPQYGTRRQRRAATKSIINQLEQMKAAEELSHKNTPENLQSTEAYDNAEESISALDEAIESLKSAY